MTRRLALWGVLIAVASHLTAQTIRSEPPFEPPFPGSVSVGDALVASAEGFDALYSNPAGFARGKPSFTLIAAAPGLNGLLDTSTPGLLREAWRAPSTSADVLGPLFGAGGFGGSAAAGIGYTGSGLGLGLLASSELWGTTPSNVRAVATVAFVGGMGFNVGKHLLIGGDVRPMFRLHVPSASIGDLLAFAKDPVTAGSGVMSLYGVAVGLDLGAIATFGPLSYGFTLTDIGGTSFYYSADSLNAIATGLVLGGGLPTGQTVADNYVAPMQAAVGVAYHPDLGRSARFFDPKLEVDYAYRFDPSRSSQVALSTILLDGIHAGIDIGLLSFFHLRAGYQFGRLSAGVGIKLPGVQIDAAGFQQVAPTAQSGPTQGVSAGLSIRF